MKPERLEDLGRLREKLTQIIDDWGHDILIPDPKRAKDFAEWCNSLSEDKRYDVLNQMAYALDEALSKLYDCLLIAKGDDE